MRKPLIFLIGAVLSGCSSVNIDSDSYNLFGGVIPKSLDKLPFIYRPTIVQGNVITQEMVDKLELGMDKKQVEFALGTPMLRDPFHDSRWDYYYGIGIGGVELEKYLTLEFEGNRLAKISGDYAPQPPAEDEGKPEPVESIITVPDWQPPPKTLYQQLIGTVGLDTEDEAKAHSEPPKPGSGAKGDTDK